MLREALYSKSCCLNVMIAAAGVAPPRGAGQHLLVSCLFVWKLAVQ